MAKYSLNSGENIEGKRPKFIKKAGERIGHIVLRSGKSARNIALQKVKGTSLVRNKHRALDEGIKQALKDKKLHDYVHKHTDPKSGEYFGKR